jgi:D-aminopeptidase
VRSRIRGLGVSIGDLPVGEHNAITDVPGVRVGHQTVVRDDPTVTRTGVTMIVPREGGIWSDYAYCGTAVLNGNGEMTGMPWIEESGMLGSPIGITNTFQVGMVRDAMVRYSVDHGLDRHFILPVAAETDDSHLNDAESFPLTPDDAVAALEAASTGAVDEGNVGGGTGMICHEFKGGIGTSSRIVDVGPMKVTVGALVQANYGWRTDLRIGESPIGRKIGTDVVPSTWEDDEDLESSSSIIVVVATDAPLLADQCKRLARRATVGLARVGGNGHDSSGDLFLAFATGNHLPRGQAVRDVRSLDHELVTPLIRATADVVEESILNALCAAETMTGRSGRVAHELPLDLVEEVLNGADGDEK